MPRSPFLAFPLLSASALLGLVVSLPTTHVTAQPRLASSVPIKLMLPADHAVITEADLKARKQTIIFTWTRHEFGEAYNIEISTDPAFQKNLLQRHVTRNLFAYRGLQGGVYYWRVSSDLGGKTGVFSFTVKAPVTRPNPFVAPQPPAPPAKAPSAKVLPAAARHR